MANMMQKAQPLTSWCTKDRLRVNGRWISLGATRDEARMVLGVPDEIDQIEDEPVWLYRIGRFEITLFWHKDLVEEILLVA